MIHFGVRWHGCLPLPLPLPLPLSLLWALLMLLLLLLSLLSLFRGRHWCGCWAGVSADARARRCLVGRLVGRCRRGTTWSRYFKWLDQFPHISSLSHATMQEHAQGLKQKLPHHVKEHVGSKGWGWLPRGRTGACRHGGGARQHLALPAKWLRAACESAGPS